MEKKEFQSLFRETMKSYGFRIRGNYAHKFVTDDYLIGVFLVNGLFEGEYNIQYGVIYEPEKVKGSFRGRCDWTSWFEFTFFQGDDLANYPIERLGVNFIHLPITRSFRYKKQTAEDFRRCVAVNMEKRVSPLYNPEFALALYRDRWTYFGEISPETAEKVARLAGLDVEEVMRFRENLIVKPTKKTRRRKKTKKK